MQIEFLKPARMDDVLEVVTEYEEIKGASITLKQQVLRGEELLVEAHVRVAFVSGGRARPIPKPLRIAMKTEAGDGGQTTRRMRRQHLAVVSSLRAVDGSARVCKSYLHELVEAWPRRRAATTTAISKRPWSAPRSN